MQNGANIWPKLKNLKFQCLPSSCDKRAIFGVVFWFYVDPNPRGEGLPYKSDRDAHRLALGCRLQILVSLRPFAMERHYICPFRYRWVLLIKKFTKNALTLTTQKSPLGGQYKLEPHPHWSPFGIKFEFSNEYPCHFCMGVPSGPIPPTPLPGGFFAKGINLGIMEIIAS